MKEPLPEVELYSIGSEEAEYAAPLLTGEAVAQIKAGMACGMALVEEGEARAAVCARILPENETHLELISLYVAPAYRRRALGSTLLMELLEEYMSDTDGTLEYVTAVYPQTADGLEAFFSYAGFVTEDEEALMSWQISLSELKRSPMSRRRIAVPDGYFLRTLEMAQDLDLRRLSDELEQNEIADLTLPQMRQALTDASYFLLNSRQEPVACVIVSEQENGHIYLSQFFAANGDTTCGLIVLQAAADALLARLPEQTVLEIPTIADSSARLVQRLLPDCHATHIQRATLDLTRTETV